MPLFSEKQKTVFTNLFGEYEDEQLTQPELEVTKNEIQALENFLAKAEIRLPDSKVMTNDEFLAIFKVNVFSYFCPLKNQHRTFR